MTLDFLYSCFVVPVPAVISPEVGPVSDYDQLTVDGVCGLIG